MRLRLAGTTFALAAGITAAVSLASAAGAYLYSIRHSSTLLDTARRNALGQAELIRGALEHAMLEDNRTLIGQMVNAFGREPRVLNVMLLDRDGVVQFSSGLVEAGAELSIESATCQACHRHPPGQRASSRVIETMDGSILRTVVPFRNRAECHECHDPAAAINGVLISDLDAAEIRAAANRDLRWMVAVSAAITLLLVAAIGMVVRLAVLRRLQRFETTARLIAKGDLARRVPASGTDTISWLAKEFNTMADSISGLVGQVRSERERLETVINSIDDGIVVLDAERRVVAANNAFLARTGRVRDALLGCSCREEGTGTCTVTDCPTLACLQTGERQIRICERQKPDGTVAWEEVHASPIDGLSGDPAHVVEVWRDISDRRAAEARLAESHRLASLGLLASGFSHEMNTPLGTVLACVEGIVREARSNSASSDWTYIRENASTARDQVMRCRGITQQFLRMARGQPSGTQIVDIAGALAAAIRLIDPTARARGVTLHASLPSPGSLRVRTDEAELQHAVVNLILNAVQACPSGGAVEIGATRTDLRGSDGVRITVSDNGCGIAPEDHRRIFEPFFSMRPGGTGLGLFLSLNSIRRSGGDIAVDSTAGAGSTFAIVLPALDQVGEAVRA
jgi:PAS domain S-box-containing protein